MVHDMVCYRYCPQLVMEYRGIRKQNGVWGLGYNDPNIPYLDLPVIYKPITTGATDLSPQVKVMAGRTGRNRSSPMTV